MAGCSWLVQVLAVFGTFSLLATLGVVWIAIAADRADRKARPDAEPVKVPWRAELAERVRGWWATADLGWVFFAVGVVVLALIVFWLILDVANGRWEVP